MHRGESLGQNIGKCLTSYEAIKWLFKVVVLSYTLFKTFSQKINMLEWDLCTAFCQTPNSLFSYQAGQLASLNMGQDSVNIDISVYILFSHSL